MSISSRITIDDGTTSVDVDGIASLGIEVDEKDAGGRGFLRMGNGAVVTQVRWEKSIVRIACTGWKSPKLSTGWGSLDWSQPITVTIPTQAGTRQFTGDCPEPSVVETVSEAVNVRWTFDLTET